MDLDVLKGILTAIEMKDGSTAAHTWRVVLYARAMAEAAGRSHDDIERLSLAAALHDVGKIDIPDAILLKPGPLTPNEYAEMQQHTVHGHERLLTLTHDDPLALELVRHHHERWDGTGYPDRIAGEDIPVPARYFAVIDTFDAMTSVRPYRQDVGPEAQARALEALRAGSGTQYWPEAVEMFCALLRDGELDWIFNEYNDAATTPTIAEMLRR